MENLLILSAGIMAASYSFPPVQFRDLLTPLGDSRTLIRVARWIELFFAFAHSLTMDLGRRNEPNATESSNGEFSHPSLWTVVLYDGPVIQERAIHLLEDMHRQASPRRRLRIDTLPLAALDDSPLNRHVNWSLQRAQMIVVAVSAGRSLSSIAISHLESYLTQDTKNLSLLGFLEGRSPAARQPGYAFDQLQKMASMSGVDFFVHIADPAPFGAALYLAYTESSFPVMPPENL